MQAQRYQVSATKSSFTRKGLEYLGYRISREGIQALTSNVESIQRSLDTSNNFIREQHASSGRHYSKNQTKLYQALSPARSKIFASNAPVQLQSTLLDVLHCLQLGQLKYSRNCFFEQTRASPSTLTKNFNAVATSIGYLFKRQSDRI
jgi:hypothetical protein